MAKYKRYEKYKYSGVEWIGQVPEHWTVNRIKFAVELVVLKAREEDTVKPYIGLEHIESGTGKYSIPENGVSDEVTANIFAPGMVLFGKLRPYLAKCIRVNYHGRCSSELLTLRATSKITGEFLKYFLLTDGAIKEIDSSTYGAKMPRASWEFISNIMMPLPSLREQRSIADYLNQKTAEIDDLIADKEKLIEELQEYRQAIISEAVTKGLDPDVKMKDSGVEWIGEIPEHWELERIKHFCTINPTKTEINNWAAETEVSFLPMESIGTDGLLDLESTRQIKDVFSGYTYCAENDVIVAKITPCFENGKGAICRGLKNGIAFGTTELFVLRPKGHIDSAYVYYLTKTWPFRVTGAALMQGAAGQKRVTDEFIREFQLGLPSFHEQQVIANFLEHKTSEIDDLIANIKTSIANLKQYRQSLISEAVTGKIDVRGAM